MIPKEVYNRKHNSTPWFILVTMANYIVFSVLLSFYHGVKLNWFFWLVLALLVFYNFTEIRKNREDITRTTLIIYIVNVLVVAIGWTIFYVLA